MLTAVRTSESAAFPEEVGSLFELITFSVQWLPAVSAKGRSHPDEKDIDVHIQIDRICGFSNAGPLDETRRDLEVGQMLFTWVCKLH